MQAESDHPLIVGAGPVGLAAALFLARRGVRVRLIERRHHASTESRALAVNPRTLDILDPTGVTASMLEIGRPIHGARFWKRSGRIGETHFEGIHPRYPFLLALTQATSERLLAEALEAAGGVIERGVELVGVVGRRTDGGRVEATVEPAGGGDRVTTTHPWMLAADGAHSVARHSLGVNFPGSALAEPWGLADAPLRTDLDRDRAHAFILERGVFLFLIPVVGDHAGTEAADDIWRLVSNRPDPLGRLVRAEQAGPAIWESEFTVAHRIAETFSTGGVHFAGDAAHIHSPFGARGMNLGIEDAAVFAALAAHGRLGEYAASRAPIDRDVVHRVREVTKIIACASATDRMIRALMLPIGLRFPALRRQVVRMAAGLDHEMPEVIGASF
ncbi:MAG: FAD-dependent monooxygenase [Phycisphaeraceae bacterium]|nr:FAD-dependent monooxygenase [Phycisphaeraceae bacterium]